ncbi:hypothetical protein CLOP_g22434 [Closterium sp. NIES-67]|nr:hypothetical protein CLOP_g22434 [Closterium sp. NIES-67]
MHCCEWTRREGRTRRGGGRRGGAVQQQGRGGRLACSAGGGNSSGSGGRGGRAQCSSSKCGCSYGASHGWPATQHARKQARSARTAVRVAGASSRDGAAAQEQGGSEAALGEASRAAEPSGAGGAASTGQEAGVQREARGEAGAAVGAGAGSGASAESTVKDGKWVGASHRVLFCSQCGSPTNQIVPAGDDKPRDVCSNPVCARIHYANPKVVVGALCLWHNKVLLCRRGIPPCEGMWGFPQGFLELGESSREGAEREVREEACAEVRVRSLLAVYNIPNQVQIIYLADLLSPHFAAGSETLEAALFEWDAIPFHHLAFPTVAWALEHAQQQLQHAQGLIQPQLRTKVAGTAGMFSGSYVDA